MRRLPIPLLLLGALALAPAAAEAKLFDVNNDLRQDLVVGLPGWQISDGAEVGAIYVRGAKRGLLGRVSVLTRKELGVPEGGSNAMIGASVTSADFDGDDFEDLAFGARGAVVIAYGASSFPSVPRTTILRAVDGEDPSLIAGDMNGENVDDLALGPGDLDLYFGKNGDGITQPPDATLAPPEGAGANFGFVLAHGDVTGDGHAELFEAAPGIPDFADDPPQPGHVSVALGRERGPRPLEWVAQRMRGGPVSLAIGDVDGDRYGDLVAGIPVDDFVGEDDRGTAGAVKVWFGGPESLSKQPMTITQGSPGIPGTNEQFDRFGASVAVGKLDNDRYADIVVGAPVENKSRGRVTIIRGGPAGYARTGNRSFGFETRGVPGDFKRGDRNFGLQVGLLDFSGDDRLDLALLDRGFDRSIQQRSRRGGVTVLRGTRRGISFKRAARLTFFGEGVVPGERGEAPVLG
ncbi:MAG: integrin alpha, partial [Thermoleophilaceae bacterium]